MKARRQDVKRYTISNLDDDDKAWMLEKLGTVVEIVGGRARVIVTDGDKDRTIEIPAGFWCELKEAE